MPEKKMLAKSELSESEIINLKERLAELELALEDVGWMSVAYSDNEQAFTREALGRIAYLSRIMYLKNPLINRGVNVKRNYVWGQDVSIKSKDPEVDAVIQQFMKDRDNKAELTGHTAQTTKETDLECDGNLFLVLFTDKSKTGGVKVRSLPFSQIMDIVTDPEDAKKNQYYRRVWQDQAGHEQKAYYPDYLYSPKDKPDFYKDVKVRWDAPVLHIKVGGFSDWKFGVSEVYSALDWAKAYKEFLEDFATIMRAYSRFAWKMTAKGSKARTALKSKLNTETGTESGVSVKPPTVGAYAITDPSMDMQPIKTAGAATSPSEGRRLLLMVASAVGLPETFFGDVSVGTLATANSLDRPTELNMLDRQALWKEVFTNLLNYVLLYAIKTKNLTGKAALIPVENSIEQIKWQEGDFQDVVEITFPPILQSDKAQDVQAVVNAATLGNGMSTGMIDDETVVRMLLNALGEKNIDQVIAHMQSQKTELGAVVESFMKKYRNKK